MMDQTNVHPVTAININIALQLLEQTIIQRVGNCICLLPVSDRYRGLLRLMGHSLSRIWLTIILRLVPYLPPWDIQSFLIFLERSERNYLESKHLICLDNKRFRNCSDDKSAYTYILAMYVFYIIIVFRWY